MWALRFIDNGVAHEIAVAPGPKASDKVAYPVNRVGENQCYKDYMTLLSTKANMQAIRLHRGAACLFTVFAVYYVIEARTYSYMDSTGPGAGFFPLWIGAISFLVGLGLLMTAASVEEAAKPAEGVEPGSRCVIVITLLSLCVAASLLETLGFRVTTFLMLITLLKAYGTGLRIALVRSLVISVSVFLLFQALNVFLPIGILGF